MSKIIRDINKLTERMQKKVIPFLAEVKELDCYVFETYRTQARQDELYAQGRTKPGKVVTKKKVSRHTKGDAIDMAFGGEGKWYWLGENDPKWEIMRQIASKYGLENLGEWDKPHLQDDGKEFNQNDMEFKNDYYKIMKDEMGDGPFVISHNAAATNDFEEQIKALIELSIDRKVKKILEKLNK